MTITMNQETATPQCVLENLENQVLSRLGRRIRGFRVQLLNGGLMLTGTTTTYYAKQMAQHYVMEMTNLRILSNAIEVV